jgi:hypothetical protein
LGLQQCTGGYGVDDPGCSRGETFHSCPAREWTAAASQWSATSHRRSFTGYCTRASRARSAIKSPPQTQTAQPHNGCR